MHKYIFLRLVLVVGIWCLNNVTYMHAQMTSGMDTVYGHEWIRYNQTYFKMRVADESIYKLSFGELKAAGFPIETVMGRNIQVYSRGVQIPVYMNTDGALSESDYLVFYGTPNRSELDSFLFANGEADMLNPGYSLVNDSAAYFLTWNENPGLRYVLMPNDLQNLPDPEPYFMDEIRIHQHASFIKRPNGAGSLSRFSSGEGFCGAAVVNAQVDFATPHIYSAGPVSRLEIRLSSNNSRDHELQLLFNDVQLETLSFNNFNFISKTYNLSSADLLSMNKFNFVRLGAAENRYSLGMSRIEYPSLFRLGSQSFKTWRPLRAGKQQISWELSLPDTEEFWLFDPQLRQIIKASPEAGKLLFGYAPASTSSLVLGMRSAFRSVPEIQQVNFVNLTVNTGNYLIVSHEELINGPTGNGQVQAYADYRSSEDGGSFNVQIIDIQQLYDQFGYGVDRHFIALRNFFHYLKTFGAEIDHVLLLGKGRDFRTIRSPAQVAAAGSFFVPTFGGPGADMLLVCGDQDLYPIFSLGRIPAINGDDIRVYLDKVIEYENAQRYPIAEADRFWQKRVLHLSGGSSAAEREQLKQIMSRVGEEIQTNAFTANLFSYAKLSSDPVEGNVPEEIYGLINGGISLLSFLGHSGSTTIDFNIDNFSQIQNKGKYPIFLALGCSVGNVHTPDKGYGERFTFAKDEGAIAFIASTGLGYPSILENYSHKFYEILGDPSKNSIGNTLVEVNRAFSNTGNRLFQEQLEQTTINGDPAIRINTPEGPDYTFDFESAHILEGNVNITQDSFQFAVDIINLGSGIHDSIEVLLERVFPDGSQDAYNFRVDGLGYRNSLKYKLPVVGEKSLGVNHITLTIDPNNAISELPAGMAVENNKLISNTGEEGFRLFIFGINATPAYPANLALIQSTDISLTAFTGNLFAPGRNYVFELDTSEAFNSLRKERKTINSKGGVIKWKPERPFENNQTYFWRVSSDSLSPAETFNWETASFSIASEEGEGLSMRHPDQLRKINNESLFLNEEKNWELGAINRGLEIKNGIYTGSGFPAGAIDGFNYGSMFPFNILTEGVLVQIIDPETGLHWRNPPGGLYGSLNTTPSTNLFTFPFNTKIKTQRDSLIKLLNDIIPIGHTVLVYSILRTPASSLATEEWALDSLDNNGLNLFNLLESEGLNSIRSLESLGTRSFIVAYSKGEKVLFEGIANNPENAVDFIYAYREKKDRGAVSWKTESYFSGVDSVKWVVTSSESMVNDTVSIKIKAFDKEGLQLYAQNINQEHTGFVAPDTSLNISFVETEFSVFNAARVSGQLEEWSVVGNVLPDLLLYQEDHDFTQVDTVARGEQYPVDIIIENLERQFADTVWLTIRLRQNNQLLSERNVKIPSIPAFSHFKLEEAISTLDLNGLVQIELTLNESRELQELRYTNNFGSWDVYIEGDSKNPLLRAYFDGLEIMDGDLISAKPEISITLLDENPYLLLKDTSLIDVQLLVPGSNSWERVAFSAGQMIFFPAENEEKNEASIIYRPDFLKDGEYHLRVQARDASGNNSGGQAYQKKFQVITKQMISSLINYPNPFSTQTRFVYTLTGSESPAFFKIQIYTVSGQLVREISHLEIGALKVGTHLTDYVWDGKDEYGNMLANGVYIYRMYTKNQSQKDVEHFETQSDEFVTNGWSKMVILR